ncbi:DUF6878 family protein [Ralstonia pseudosolanacearum]|uniref:DUF6878 family protein n=1 Tax=Ralstonia pseudosolanacearum TaxID=1310165 RepID=UPI0008F85E42|nr:DUF6878 family protein [Ralstonia pseudosolanacearum]API73562.1 hypothetical protein AC251_02735 [Ralstonia pseudosolanacearum]NKA07344.1 hypothetical protein [Ralstonia solanacearum]OIN73230.1 hypothetical protein BL247_08635 [Ralstonia solanacearum]QWF61548.1 hypothetical protein KM864_02795 [Ralstonia solanacearum]
MSDTQTTDPVLSRNRTVLLEALRTAGAATAVIAYSGYGDSGNANDISLLGADGQEVNADLTVHVMREDARYVDGQWQSAHAMVDLSLRDALDAFGDRAVSLHHPGFENNDGGDGEIAFDVAAGTVCMAHRDHYVEHFHTDTDL